jgi:hypothetical protein
MQVLRSFLGEASTPNTVGAWATATQKSAQISCALPIGACMLPGGTPSNPYAGLVVGQWLSSKLSASATGSFDWIDFTPPGGGAQELADIIKGQGQCNLSAAGQMVGEQGNKASLDKAWNTRFGLYHGSDDATTAPPDFTGYAYTPTNWPSKFNVFAGTSTTGVPNFQTTRASHMPYQGGSAAGLSLLPPGNGYSNSSSSDLANRGADRRLVTVPVVDCSAWAASNPQQVPVLGYACVLILHPMTQDADEVWLEYRGASNDPSSPCSTSGLAGGTAGPLVPALVH